MTCGSWKSMGWAYGHEIPCVCDRSRGHQGDHTGVFEGRRLRWSKFYPRYGEN